MKALLQSLVDWLHEGKSDSKAWRILDVLARETIKVADSADPEQREFDALDIAQACEPDRGWSYDSAKKWLIGAEVPKYLNARRSQFEAFFRDRGHSQALAVEQRKSTGRYRSPWFLCTYDLPGLEHDYGEVGESPVQKNQPNTGSGVVAHKLAYEFTPSGNIKLSVLGRLFLGTGSIRTRSPRALLWAALWLGALLLALLCLFFFWAMSWSGRPLTTGDLIAAFLLLGCTWVVWRSCILPLTWLLDDRMLLGGAILSTWHEGPTQLDMARDGNHRYIRLVRYSGVCPVCAGTIELRYGQGVNARRIFGCCSEAPQEHVFTFDRVTRIGLRYES
ncbi:MAG: hypothetical protein WAW69_15970 [Polaromonas sp.]